VNPRIAEISQWALAGERLKRAELLELATLGERNPHDLLYWANRVRTDRFGDCVRACSIVPGKLGACPEDCKWCAQSARGAPNVTPFRRTPMAEILQAADEAAKNRVPNLGIVNSGKAPAGGDLDDVVEAARKIAQAHGDTLHVCASMGELTDEQARRLAQAGVSRYHHNLETSRRFFPNVVTTHEYDSRLRTLRAARQAGMSVCCGGLFGMGETAEDRVDLAVTIRDEVGADVVPLNFLHPIPGTALADREPMKPMEILAVIALFRLAMPDVDLKVAGGREKNRRDAQSWIFHAGATSIMTGRYLTTAGRGADEDARMVADLGLRLVAELPRRGAVRGRVGPR